MDWYAVLNSLPALANMPHPHPLHPDITVSVTTTIIVIHPEKGMGETQENERGETQEIQETQEKERGILGGLNLYPDLLHQDL